MFLLRGRFCVEKPGAGFGGQIRCPLIYMLAGAARTRCGELVERQRHDELPALRTVAHIAGRWSRQRRRVAGERRSSCGVSLGPVPYF